MTTESPATPRRVLCIMAHPDDTEFFCGATLALWARDGAEVTIAIVTDGSRGSNDPEMTSERLIPLRQAEQRAAAQALGAKEVLFLGYPDGYLVPDLDLRRALTRLIRQVQPDAVVCPDPTVYWYDEGYINHPDHRGTGQATLDAVQPAVGSRFFFPELLAEGYPPHQVKELYLAGALQPNVEIDVTATIGARLAALREHRSQIQNMDQIEQWAREEGEQTGSKEAPRWLEKFRRFKFE